MSELNEGFPNFEYDFEINVLGDTTKKRWTGNFTYLSPTIGMDSDIARFKSQLDGENYKAVPKSMKNLHFALATLRYCITRAPKWWENSNFGADLRDYNVVWEMFNKITEFETKSRKDLPNIVEKEVEASKQNNDKVTDEE